MQLFIHRSNVGGTAVTADRPGTSLPPNAGPWTLQTEIDLQEGLSPPSGLNLIDMLQIMDRDGYYLVPPGVELEGPEFDATDPEQ